MLTQEVTQVEVIKTKRTVCIVVTPADIQAAEEDRYIGLRGLNCPIAKAALRAFGKRIWVAPSGLYDYTSNEVQIAELPDDAQKFIKRFDNFFLDDLVEPIEFCVEVD